ncbi:MAG: alanine racemase [Planctomycetaceae bacterium]|nr:alanine racemase [Planctomycetaceae bacterium]
MQDTSAIDIDLSAIDHNMAAIRRAVGDRCALCPIVKADAYGLGVARVARRLASAGAAMLAVYSLRQAIETAAAVNGATPVLVLMPVTDLPREDELVRLMIAGQLHLTVHDMAGLAALESAALLHGVRLPIHVEIDVGMSRGGASPEEAGQMLRAIDGNPSFELRGIYAHFSHSRFDEARTRAQHEIYARTVEANRRFIPSGVLEHVASTYALARSGAYHRSMVRFGLAWLGYGLDELEADAPVLAPRDLRPVIRWTSSIVQARSVPAGASVGYGGRWVAERDSTIALVPVGYADGWPAPRHTGASTQFVSIEAPDGRIVHAPVVGAVNMDQITIDVTGLHAGDAHDWIGREVELVSRDPMAPNHLPRLAAQSGMIVHEFLTRMNPRIARTTSLGSGSIEVLAAAREALDRRTAVASVNSAAG